LTYKAGDAVQANSRRPVTRMSYLDFETIGIAGKCHGQVRMVPCEMLKGFFAGSDDRLLKFGRFLVRQPRRLRQKARSASRPSR
jgi:hypothetical protein